MSAVYAPAKLIAPDPTEGPAMRALGDRLDELEAQHQQALLVGPTGQQIAIPASAFEALQGVVFAMAQGLTITLVPQGKELSTKQAADLLHVSRPFLVRNLLGKPGGLPYEKVGSHRRVLLSDVLAYRQTREAERRQLLDDMTAAAQDIEGGYR